MATLLPPPEIQFIDSNGNPVAGGTVAFYVPGTTTPKDTYQDAGQILLNTNPVTLDSAGRAIIYGSGTYRVVLKDASGNLIYDQLSADTAVGGLAWGGTSTGTANAQVIAASSFTSQNGQQISFIVGAGLTNTGGLTVDPGGSGGIAVLKDTVSGPTALIGGEVAAGNAVTLLYDSARGAFHLINQPVQAIPPGAIWMFGMNTAPAGWLACDGSAVSRAVYAGLFAAVGTTFGAGNGTTTFNVPPNGYFPRMWNGSGSGIDPSRVFGSTQTDAFKSHTHTANVTDPGHVHTVSGAANIGSSGTVSIAAALPNTATQNTSTVTTGITVSNTSTGGTETRPQNLALLFAIKT